VTEYKHVDILASPEIRKLCKVYSDWPTFPQLFVHGDLIGGADIVGEMHKDGSLKKLVETIKESPKE
jgi:monothiol glutaredoxin